MERILNEDERMRRAEEIYFKRNNQNIRLTQDEENKTKKFDVNKLVIYFLVLLDITILILCIQNREYIFTTEFLQKCQEYNKRVSDKVNQVVGSFLIDNTISENITIENQLVQENTEQNKDETSEQNNTEALKENNVEAVQENNNDNQENIESSLSEMENDVQNLKNAYSFIKPISATISSVFGARESQYQNVKGYHTGIDLAAEKGTLIKASMQGIVTLVSNEGDYRKTFKNKM